MKSVPVKCPLLLAGYFLILHSREQAWCAPQATIYQYMDGIMTSYIKRNTDIMISLNAVSLRDRTL